MEELNRCRIFQQATCLSDIATGDSSSIPQNMWKGGGGIGTMTATPGHLNQFHIKNHGRTGKWPPPPRTICPNLWRSPTTIN